MRKRSLIIFVSVPIALAAVGGLIAMSRSRPLAGPDAIPIAKVTRGDLSINVHAILTFVEVSNSLFQFDGSAKWSITMCSWIFHCLLQSFDNMGRSRLIGISPT